MHLLVHETTGAFDQHAARRLRALGRAAAELGCDGTDYSKSYTANSFVPYYAQRMSSCSVLGDAASIHRSIEKGINARLRKAAGTTRASGRASSSRSCATQ